MQDRFASFWREQVRQFHSFCSKHKVTINCSCGPPLQLSCPHGFVSVPTTLMYLVTHSFTYKSPECSRLFTAICFARHQIAQIRSPVKYLKQGKNTVGIFANLTCHKSFISKEKTPILMEILNVSTDRSVQIKILNDCSRYDTKAAQNAKYVKD